jgi:anaerobic selenocysteine-containing dehydrogenase
MLQNNEHIMQGDDVWVPTVCAGCYNCCGIKVHRVDGRVVEVKGDPEAINSQGRICAKGMSRALDVHSPNRIYKPLKRTNPKKGIGVDPQWVEISWEEALSTITEKLKAIRQDDPRKLIISHFDISGYKVSGTFGAVFGTNNFHWNRACYCGSASHPTWLITNGTLNSEVDFEYCKYVVLWGTQLGHMVNTIGLTAGSALADSRRKGAKLVVVDPFCSAAASKADEWLPVKPGTDGALALAMLGVMVGELKVWDAEFLRDQTNAIYLVKTDDGLYVRNPDTGQPMVWDQADQTAKDYNDEKLKDAAIEGEFEVDGVKCKPSFQVLKEYLCSIDIEEMARVCTVPAEQIRRVTKEFCDTATIGATIEIDGKTLPLRPVGIDYKRGATAHRGGMNSTFAIHLLNLLVGAVDVPGGQRGVNPIGPYWSAEVGPDGLMQPADYIAKYQKPYPGSPAKVPVKLDLQELFPASLFTRGLYPWGINEPEKFGLTYQPEMMIHCRTNLMMNSHNPEEMAETLKKLKFQVSMGVFIDETCEFADIMLPDAHDFERWDMFPANDPYAFIAPGPGWWYWLMRQPVVPLPDEVRPWVDVYIELAKRLGMLDEIYRAGNEAWLLDEKHQLEIGRDYTLREIAEKQAKSLLGDQFSWEHLQQTACWVTRKKTVEESFPSTFFKSRMPIYLEYLLRHGADVKKITESLNLEWDFYAYSAVPLWIPCEAHEKDPEFPLIATNCKLPTHMFSVTTENPWIDEIASRSPYSYTVMIHTSAAARYHLKDGDTICVESRYGKYTGKLKVTELIHPDCVGSCGTFGHWAKGMPVSRGKGVGHNFLLPTPNLKRIDTVSGQIDQCVSVKIYKV